MKLQELKRLVVIALFVITPKIVEEIVNSERNRRVDSLFHFLGSWRRLRIEFRSSWMLDFLLWGFAWIEEEEEEEEDDDDEQGCSGLLTVGNAEGVTLLED